jgi:transcription elongation GreA/GreB family factor
MSRAFVKETDGTHENLADRPISPHPNLVTREGLELIEATLGRLRRERSVALGADDHASQARIERDLRYWVARRSTAQVAPTIAPPSASGCTVTIARNDGRRQTYRIVGEDEADPARGTVSYVSALARALMGKQAGDTISLGNSEAEILAIESR